jgi:hypothetical protein
MQEILKTPDAQRDQSWENKFFQALMLTNLKLLSPEPQTGPDSWPYLLAEIDDSATESPHQILNWLAEKGIGLALNPMKEYPDYVFSYGMIWSFKETGFFYKPIPMRESGVVDFDIGSLVHAGSPTEEYLPTYVKKIMKEFFRDQGILAPKILLISTDRKNYDLAISLESLGNPPDAEHQGIAEAVSWFLPPHYSLLLVSEEGMPPFFEL